MADSSQSPATSAVLRAVIAEAMAPVLGGAADSASQLSTYDDATKKCIATTKRVCAEHEQMVKEFRAMCPSDPLLPELNENLTKYAFHAILATQSRAAEGGGISVELLIVGYEQLQLRRPKMTHLAEKWIQENFFKGFRYTDSDWSDFFDLFASEHGVAKVRRAEKIMFIAVAMLTSIVFRMVKSNDAALTDNRPYDIVLAVGKRFVKKLPKDDSKVTNDTTRDAVGQACELLGKLIDKVEAQSHP